MKARLLRLAGACALSIGAAGCRHKQTLLPVIPAPTPVAIASAPVPSAPPQLPTESAGQPPLGTVPLVPSTPAKITKKKITPAPAPVEVASAPPPPPPPVAIGSLTLAGGSSGVDRKTATDLLASNDKRLAGLSTQLKDRQKDQIDRVRSFQVDGQKALSAGDIEGAMTLATKAKVLLDEITK